MVLDGLYAQLITANSVTSVIAPLPPPAKYAIFEVRAIKQPPVPYLVMTNVSGPPAGSTLDGTSDLIDGEIQFDAYGSTPQTAKKLAHAVRDYLMRTFTAGSLPDGTNIQFVDVSLDHDEGYELGGTDYVYRRLLRLKAFYTEAS